MAFPGVFDRETFYLEPSPVIFMYLKKMRERDREVAELHSHAVAIQTSLFYNTHKSKNAPFAEAKDFNPFEQTTTQIHKSTAVEFFRLTEAHKLPGWVVALAPVRELRRIAGKTPPSRRHIRT